MGDPSVGIGGPPYCTYTIRLNGEANATTNTLELALQATAVADPFRSEYNRQTINAEPPLLPMRNPNREQRRGGRARALRPPTPGRYR